MSVLQDFGILALEALRRPFGGAAAAAAPDEVTDFLAPPIAVYSEAFKPGRPIPRKYTADGENVSPPLSWSGVPADARSLVLLVEDQDAPLVKPLVHWLAYNLPADEFELPEDVAPIPVVRSLGLLHGKNSLLRCGYGGPAPVPGDLPHRYTFRLYALDVVLPLEPGARRGTVLRAMAGHVLAMGELVGTYRR